MNANPNTQQAAPARRDQRLENRLAAVAAGKALRIVVPGKCKVCKRRSPDVPATKTQAMAWFSSKATDGFKAYEVRMLKEGLHRECQRTFDQQKKERSQKRAQRQAAKKAVPMEAVDIDRAIARAAQGGRRKGGGQRRRRESPTQVVIRVAEQEARQKRANA